MIEIADDGRKTADDGGKKFSFARAQSVATHYQNGGLVQKRITDQISCLKVRFFNEKTLPVLVLCGEHIDKTLFYKFQLGLRR